MYKVTANMYYYNRDFHSFKEAIIESNKLVKEGRKVSIFRAGKLIKEN